MMSSTCTTVCQWVAIVSVYLHKELVCTVLVCSGNLDLSPLTTDGASYLSHELAIQDLKKDKIQVSLALRNTFQPPADSRCS